MKKYINYLQVRFFLLYLCSEFFSKRKYTVRKVFRFGLLGQILTY